MAATQPPKGGSTNPKRGAQLHKVLEVQKQLQDVSYITVGKAEGSVPLTTKTTNSPEIIVVLTDCIQENTSKANEAE